MKSFYLIVDAVTIYCPNCDSCMELEDDNGTGNYQEGEFEGLPSVVTCPSCGEKCRKPSFNFDRRRA